MYKDFRYINAGENEIYRYGHKAVERLEACLQPNQAGWINLPVGYETFPIDYSKYWTIGTSNGKFGEYCRIGGTCFSVNKNGNAYAKAGTEKGDKLTAAIKAMVEEMKRLSKEAAGSDDED